MSNNGPRVWGDDDFCGGDLAVDFVNTISGVGTNRVRERLHDYADLVGWAAAAGAVPADLSADLLDRAAADRDAAVATLAEALVFREAVFSVLEAMRTGRALPADSLLTVNRFLAAALAHRRLDLDDGRVVWAWPSEPSLDRLLWPVAQAVAALLTDGPTDRLRMCGATDCGWLFLDMSKNRSRRWCDMAVCGNRAKAARHYRRSRSG